MKDVSSVEALIKRKKGKGKGGKGETGGGWQRF